MEGGDSDVDSDLELETLPFRSLAKIAKSLDPTIKIKGTKIDLKLKILKLKRKQRKNEKRKRREEKKNNRISSPSSRSVSNNNDNENDNNDNSNIYKLKIKEISNDELSFWKVIKNKFIFKFIIENLKLNKFSPNYYQIVNVNSMIENKQIELLKWKLKNQDKVLEFSFKSISNKLFKNVKKDKEFYRLLFQRFPSYFSPNLTNDLLEITVNTSFDGNSNNSVVLDIMMNDKGYNFKPTINTLLIAISNLNFKAILMILEYDIDLFNQECWDILINLGSKKKIYKIFNLLVDHFELVPPDETLSTIKSTYFNQCPFASKFKVSHLKNACISISIINQLIKQQTESTLLSSNSNQQVESDDEQDESEEEEEEEELQDDENVDKSSEEYLQKEINLKRKRIQKEYKNKKLQKLKQIKLASSLSSGFLTREEIEEFEFSKKELKSTLFKFNKSYHDIKFLLKMYYSIKVSNSQVALTSASLKLKIKSLMKKNAMYQLIFKRKPSFKDVQLAKFIRTSQFNHENSMFKYALKYANVELFDKWIKNLSSGIYRFKEWFNDNIKNDKKYYHSKSTLFFKYCKNDRLKQKQFIQSLFKLYSSGNGTSNNHLCDVLFSMLVYHDDLELIELVFNDGSFNKNNFDFRNWGLIRSIPVLEFFFKNLKANENYNFKTWFNHGRVDLFTRHQELIKDNLPYFTTTSSETNSTTTATTTTATVTTPATLMVNNNNQSSIKYSKFNVDFIEQFQGPFRTFDFSNYENCVKMIKYMVSEPTTFTNTGNKFIDILKRYIRRVNYEPNMTDDIQYIVDNHTEVNSYRSLVKEEYEFNRGDIKLNEITIIEWFLINKIGDEKFNFTDSDIGNFQKLVKYNSSSIKDDSSGDEEDNDEDGAEEEDGQLPSIGLFTTLIERNNVELILQIIEKYLGRSPNGHSKRNLMEYLIKVAEGDALYILKQIYKKFTFIFKVNSARSFFGAERIRKLAFHAIANENIEMFSFLTDGNSQDNDFKPIIGLTPIQFHQRVPKGKPSFIKEIYANKYQENRYRQQVKLNKSNNNNGDSDIEIDNQDDSDSDSDSDNDNSSDDGGSNNNNDESDGEISD